MIQEEVFEKNSHKKTNDFPELRKKILELKLMDKKPLEFTSKFSIVGGCVVAALILLFAVDALWLRLLIAVFFAFTTIQIGFLMHDAGHMQICKSSKINNWLGQLMALFVGMSYRWWVHKHNEHHAHPNHEDMDPDVDVPLIAFSPKQAKEKKGLLKYFVRYQGYFFLPSLTLVSIGFRASSINYMLRNLNNKTLIDFSIFLAHFIGYLSLVFWAIQPWWHAVLFIAAHQMLTGVYMGMVFAPNHKGMEMTNDEHQLDFLREQVLTSRNIRSHPITDFMYGGLNFQIEHHLFPHMPRHRYRRIQKIVKEYCEMKGISYHETSFIKSWKEILAHMHSVSKFAR